MRYLHYLERNNVISLPCYEKRCSSLIIRMMLLAAQTPVFFVFYYVIEKIPHHGGS